MTGFTTLTRLITVGYWRDRTALFFTILFPLIFLGIVGGLFGGDGVPRSEVIVIGRVEVLDALPTEQRAQIEQVLTITRSTDPTDALAKVRAGDAAALIEQRGSEVLVRYSAADQTSAGTVRSVLDSLVQGFNVAATGQPATFTLASQPVEDASLKRIQYVTPGILGWAIAAAATFAAASTLVVWRQRGVLRHLTLTPVGPPAIVGARVAVSLGLALAQTVLFVAVAAAFFGLRLAGSWWMAIPLILTGTMAFLAIGLLAGVLSKSVETANVVSNLVVLPMAFLSGSFFPLNLGPAWVEKIAVVMPLYHLNTAMLDVLGRGVSFWHVLPQMGILLGFALVVSLIAVRQFRRQYS